MLALKDVSIRFQTKPLFEKVNLEFKEDNCYGIIGANGAGKSTFLKLLSGELETTTGEVTISKGERLSFLSQSHTEYDEFRVLDTVIMGDSKLYNIMKEKDALYMKPDFSTEDGIKVAELEAEFDDLNGWQAESDAAQLLAGLGIKNDKHDLLVGDLSDKEKVKVLLAKALFNNPDILLLDEPTNGLDVKSKLWLEDFLMNYKNTVLVVSHDRYFLNKVCTHMVDIDYGKINMFIGNYDFWVKSSELIQKQMKDSNKKKEAKKEELKAFIAKFSANASKSKQATSRKKLLEKIELDDIRPTSRKYPYINFEIEKFLGNNAVSLEKVSYKMGDKVILDNVNLFVRPDDKIALIGLNELAKTTLLKIIAGELKPDSGEVKYGATAIISYFAKNHEEYFTEERTLIDFLREYSENKEEAYVRGFLGRMLFSGEESLKDVNVLSGGEKVRLMLSKMMCEKGNILLFDEPTNHLDIESITSLDTALEKYDSVIIISTFDQEIIEKVCNRLVEIKSDGTIRDRYMEYEEYIEKFGLDS